MGLTVSIPLLNGWAWYESEDVDVIAYMAICQHEHRNRKCANTGAKAARQAWPRLARSHVGKLLQVFKYLANSLEQAFGINLGKTVLEFLGDAKRRPRHGCPLF